MGMFSPETEALRQRLAQQMTHTTGQSGGEWIQAKQRMNLLPPWYQTLSGERAGQGFTEALQAINQNRGDMQIGDTSINPIDFVNPVAGIFGGKLAKTADLMALRDAMNRATNGDDMRQIWQDTGWFQSPDGQWRFEIDDSGASMAHAIAPESGSEVRAFGPAGTHEVTLNPYMAQQLGRQADTMRGVMEHRPLFSAYDDLAQIRTDLRASPDYPFSAEASYAQGEISGRVRGGHEEMRSTMLHELQHAIQQREGFARGGSPEYGLSGPINYPLGLPMWDVLDSSDKLRRLADQFGESVPEMAARYRAAFKIDDDLMEQAIKLADDPSLPQLHAEGKKWAEMGPYEAYRRLAGEAEARAVQSRMNLTPEQRRMRFPLDDYDVPVDELIMRYGDGPAMSQKVINRELRPDDIANGQPVTFTYGRNMQKSPNMGARFGQDIEPAGRYMVSVSEKMQGGLPNMEYGQVSFKKPLVVDFGGGYQDPSNWKNALSQKYGGKKGKALSDAIKADGYDGIITIDQMGSGDRYVSEIVQLP